MWQRNSMGPSTVPCGTPESTVTCWDDSPSNVTHEIQCHKMLYHVNKEKDPQILSTWRAHIRTSRFKSISWTPNIRRPQMEYTYIEYHKEGQFNHQLPQTKFTTLSEGMQEKRLHLIS
jgi:hypothetical protein